MSLRTKTNDRRYGRVTLDDDATNFDVSQGTVYTIVSAFLKIPTARFTRC